MPCLTIPNAMGHSTIPFDSDYDPGSVVVAMEAFEALIADGWTPAKRIGPGKSEQLREFDPTAEETHFIPRYAGG